MSSKRAAGRWRAGIFVSTGVAGGLLLLAAGMALSCINSDPTAPENSTITVSAAPQSVVVANGQAGQSTITATLRSSNGTRLPGQEVLFDTSQGTLDPQAQTSLLTDRDGQVTSVLTTNTTATVTATSGTITGSTQVTTTMGAIGGIDLTVIPTNITTCSDTLTLTVDAVDPNGDGVANVAINFVQMAPSTGVTQLNGTFSASQKRTDAGGTATVTWTPSQSCDTDCGGKACGLEMKATALNNAIESNTVPITVNIP